MEVASLKDFVLNAPFFKNEEVDRVTAYNCHLYAA
jgi:hypothetical protein